VSIISRYITAQFVKFFLLCMLLTTGLFVLGDFFNRIGDLSSYESAAPMIVNYFLFRIPEAVITTYPAAALMGCMLSIGLLNRHREILAMRACGISTWRLAIPLLVASFFISLFMLAFNETVVPPASTNARNIKDYTIKKKHYAGAYNASSIWFQDDAGFVNIDYFDANRKALFGITLYQVGRDFRMQRVVEVPQAFWRNGAWDIEEGTVRTIMPNGDMVSRPLQYDDFTLNDPPIEFRRKRRKADEFNFRDLKSQIDRLQARGLDAVEFWVDLHYKLALPFSGLVSVFFAFPLAARGGRRGNLASNIAIGMVVCFAYWATMAVAVAMGRNGELPAIVAAWAGNGLFTMVGAALYLGSDI
jgi:lipopolysaccharide export system permease protein